MLDKAISEGCDQVVVIHGKGLGRVKKAVLGALDDCAAVKSYRPEQDNPGRTRVFL
jgi:dsDNA-specific endonuclease/ATPase MutS2